MTAFAPNPYNSGGDTSSGNAPSGGTSSEPEKKDKVVTRRDQYGNIVIVSGSTSTISQQLTRSRYGSGQSFSGTPGTKVTQTTPQGDVIVQEAQKGNVLKRTETRQSPVSGTGLKEVVVVGKLPRKGSEILTRDQFATTFASYSPAQKQDYFKSTMIGDFDRQGYKSKFERRKKRLTQGEITPSDKPIPFREKIVTRLFGQQGAIGLSKAEAGILAQKEAIITRSAEIEAMPDVSFKEVSSDFRLIPYAITKGAGTAVSRQVSSFAMKPVETTLITGAALIAFHGLGSGLIKSITGIGVKPIIAKTAVTTTLLTGYAATKFVKEPKSLTTPSGLIGTGTELGIYGLYYKGGKSLLKPVSTGIKTSYGKFKEYRFTSKMAKMEKGSIGSKWIGHIDEIALKPKGVVLTMKQGKIIQTTKSFTGEALRKPGYDVQRFYHEPTGLRQTGLARGGKDFLPNIKKMGNIKTEFPSTYKKLLLANQGKLTGYGFGKPVSGSQGYLLRTGGAEKLGTQTKLVGITESGKAIPKYKGLSDIDFGKGSKIKLFPSMGKKAQISVGRTSFKESPFGKLTSDFFKGRTSSISKSSTSFSTGSSISTSFNLGIGFASSPARIEKQNRKSLLGLSGLSIGSNIKPINLISPRSIPMSRVGTSSRSALAVGVASIPRLKTGVRTIQKPSSGGYFQLTSKLFDPVPRTPRPRQPRKPGKRTPPPKMPSFESTLRLRQSKKKKKQRFKRPFQYTASIQASTFNIYGKRPARLSGLELRPLTRKMRF